MLWAAAIRCEPRRSAIVAAAEAGPEEFTRERSVAFRTGNLFYRPNSRLIRDLGVLALAVAHSDRSPTAEPLRVLDAMSGTGVRSLRYALESGGATHVHSNELQFGDHPLEDNLHDIVASGACRVSHEDAVNLYLRARLDGERYDLVDCDAFGTGQPHTAEAWWAVAKGGLLYLCATDSCTTDGHNPHKATSGYAAVAHRFPASNEQGLRLLLGAAWREAAARNLHARPVFSYFHRPSSSFRVMLKLHKPKRPPSHAYASLAHVRRCVASGQLDAVPSTQLGELCSSAPSTEHQVIGPLWVGPMHDADYVRRMQTEAETRGWDDAAALLSTMASEAEAEAGGALLYYHLGEVQRLLQAEGLDLPPLGSLVSWLHAEGFTASPSHIEKKALKTSATLAQVAALVRRKAQQEEEEPEGGG